MTKAELELELEIEREKIRVMEAVLRILVPPDRIDLWDTDRFIQSEKLEKQIQDMWKAVLQND